MRISFMSLTLALIASSATAATYTVEPDGTGDFPTIQAAIDAAQDGDVVELGDGVYRGAGNRDITLLGKAISGLQAVLDDRRLYGIDDLIGALAADGNVHQGGGDMCHGPTELQSPGAVRWR